MATITTLFKSGLVESNSSFKPFPSGTMGVRKATIAVAAAVATDDVFRMIPVFDGEILHAVAVDLPDLDNDTDLVLDIGFSDLDSVATFETATGSNSAVIEDGSTVAQGAAPNAILVGAFSADDQFTAGLGPLACPAGNSFIDIHAQAGTGHSSTHGTITMYAYIS